jgi:ParB/RepB/Spo0J family partition protein
MNEFQSIPIGKLREARQNPRHHFDKQALDELAASIKTHGVLTPLLVRPSDGHFEIAAGHRRYRAAKAAGLTEVPATVRELSDLELLEILTIENLQRQDVHPLEEAQGYKSLIKAGYDVHRIAERVGRSVKYVYDRMKLLMLVKEGQELFFDGKITAGHAILLSRLSPADQKRALGAPKDEYDHHSGVFVHEDTDLLDAIEEPGEKIPVKPVSVRELQSWIDAHVRFNPAKDADPMLFPTAAANLERAKETAEKIVPITRDYQLPPDARGDERTLTTRSWRRADGEIEPGSYSKPKKSKTCDHSVLGVVVVGPGRGETFRVCIDKACAVHFAEEIREKKAREKGGGSRTRAQARETARQSAYQAREREEKARRDAWEKAAPAIALGFAEKIRAAKGIGQIADLVLRHCTGGRLSKDIEAIAPKGKTADAVLRRCAFVVVADDIFDSWNGPRRVPKLAKAFGVDLPKLLKAQGAGNVRACRKCGCTEETACQGGCSWVEEDLCSACAPKPTTKKKAAKKK